MKAILKCCVLVVYSVSMSLAAEYHVDVDRENMVKFLSDAPIEDFEGVTSRIDGYVLWDDEALDTTVGKTGSSEFYFEVPLETLDTGIGLRNRHMRDNYLETKEYPYATYQGTITSVVVGDSSAYDIALEGVFKVHGIEKTRQIKAHVDPAGDGFRVRCDFDVLLSDHNIDIPKLMFMKIDERMELTLDFYLRKAPR